MRTRVCITIDTEFSIAGAFSHATRVPVAAPLVWCNVDGRSEGLGFMLDTFQHYGVRATFFVETVQRYYFRHDPMAPIARRIHDAGHEVQLHTHPCWALFEHPDWWERSRGMRGRDDFHGMPVAQSVRLIEQGIATFREWGLPRPLAFRREDLPRLRLVERAVPLRDHERADGVADEIRKRADFRHEAIDAED